jgi:hypothetical protein
VCVRACVRACVCDVLGLRAELGRTEGRRLFFAGEAAQESSLRSSSVHGAWLSGVAAAVAATSMLRLPVTLATSLASTIRSAAAATGAAATKRVSGATRGKR